MSYIGPTDIPNDFTVFVSDEELKRIFPKPNDCSEYVYNFLIMIAHGSARRMEILLEALLKREIIPSLDAVGEREYRYIHIPPSVFLKLDELKYS
jgi:hypothetical protein